MEPQRVNEVMNLINSPNLNKIGGHHNIAPYFFRTAFGVLPSTFCYFIDNDIKFRIFPFSSKIVKAVLLFKSGEKDNLTNYRPISILTCFLNIFKNLVYSRLFGFFSKTFGPNKNSIWFSK